MDKMILTQRNGCICNLKEGLKVPKKDCFYVSLIHQMGEKLIKIGITNDLARRFYEHLHNPTYGNTDMTILLAIPCASEYAAKRLEDKVRDYLIKLGYYHLPKDRFYIPDNVHEIAIKHVRKTYVIEL